MRNSFPAHAEPLFTIHLRVEIGEADNLAGEEGGSWAAAEHTAELSVRLLHPLTHFAHLVLNRRDFRRHLWAAVQIAAQNSTLHFMFNSVIFSNIQVNKHVDNNNWEHYKVLGTTFQIYSFIHNAIQFWSNSYSQTTKQSKLRIRLFNEDNSQPLKAKFELKPWHLKNVPKYTIYKFVIYKLAI